MYAFLRSAVVAAALSVAAVGAAPASTISFLLSASVNVPNAPLPILGIDVIVSYDDTFLVTGNETLTPVSGNVTITDVDLTDLTNFDVNYPDFPELGFANFVPVFVDFLIDSTTAPELAFLGIETLWIGGDLETGDLFDFASLGTDDDTGLPIYGTGATVELAPIPLPAGLPLLLGGLGLLVLVARRRARA